MKIRNKEIVTNLHRSKYLTIIFTLHLTVILTLVGFLGVNVIFHTQSNKDFYTMFEGNQVYNIMDVGGTDVYSQKMTMDNLTSINGLYNELDSKYYRIQQITNAFQADYDDSKKDFMDGGSDEVERYSTDGIASYYSMRVNCNFFDFYQLKFVEGGSFLPNYRYERGGEVPVILGHDYSTIYRVGDVFLGNYFLFPEGTRYRVVGILDDKSLYFDLSAGGYRELDKFILVPDVDLTKDNAYREEVIIANMSQRIPSIVIEKENVLTDLKEMVASYDMSGMYRIDDQRNVVDNIYRDAQNLMKTVTTAFAAMGLFSALIIAMNCFRRLSANFERYAIHIANGASMHHIITYIMGDLAVHLIVSSLLAFGINTAVIMNLNSSFGVPNTYVLLIGCMLILFSLVTYALIYVIVKFRLRRFKISDFIRGLEP